MMKRLGLTVFMALLLSTQWLAMAQPSPGDIFRDYVWTMPEAMPEPFLRVIGDGDYREPNGLREIYPKEQIKNGWILFDQKVDLEKATRAELQVEHVLSHDGTTGFAVNINDHQWHFFDMPAAVPEPKANYLQHHYPVVSIPLEELHAGSDNNIRFRVDSIQRFGKPQNMIYGFRLRIYYEKIKKHTTATLSGLPANGNIAETQNLSLTDVRGKVAQVDYVGRFKDAGHEGNGIPRQWHYTFHRGEMRNHIGTATQAPFAVAWNTTWLPDQETDINISAWITNEEGITYFLPPKEKLHLTRDYTIELCLPYDVPEMWATRERAFDEHVVVKGDIRNASAYQLVFTSWSPGYLNGIFLNGWLMPATQDCNYCYGEHRIEHNNVKALQSGLNTISTALTPRVKGKMVHGTEIQFPGIMLLVKYDKAPVAISDTTYLEKEHFRVDTPSATYLIEKQSGGCSAMIDRQGRDWVAFKKTGNSGPTNSADSDFRGIPNLVYKEPGNGMGHPGFDVASTEQVATNELLVRSKDGLWQMRWIFHAFFAEISVERADSSRKYWMLYEGPSGGRFSPGSHYWGNSTDGLRTDQPSIFANPVSGHWQWAFFGDKTVNSALYVAQVDADTAQDYFSYMGNDKKLGNLSKDGMNVFGFGRGLQTDPQLSGQQRFIIGIYPEALNSAESLKAFTQFIEEKIDSIK